MYKHTLYCKWRSPYSLSTYTPYSLLLCTPYSLLFTYRILSCYKKYTLDMALQWYWLNLTWIWPLLMPVHRIHTKYWLNYILRTSSFCRVNYILHTTYPRKTTYTDTIYSILFLGTLYIYTTKYILDTPFYKEIYILHTIYSILFRQIKYFILIFC